MKYFFFTSLITFLLSGHLFAGTSDRYWIFLTDKKPESNLLQLDNRESFVSERALTKRKKRAEKMGPDERDNPVSSDYIRQLINLGVRIHQESRWLNAVNCYLNGIELQELEKLRFVRKIQPVKSYQRIRNLPETSTPLSQSENLDYGLSFNQNEMIGIPAAHSFGFHGENVLIAVFDTGFILDHEAFKDLRVVATWDFVNDDENVENESGDLSQQHNHGTEVLGVLAGYQPGKIIGPAYASDFILAKTEDLKSETHAEEDYWIAAAEWAESHGADMISSSLDYILDYSYEDMDGNTTLITKAADIAVEKGIAVFNSAGNEGVSAWKYIAAPADGNYVIAMGGVRPDETSWPTSSRGPTADGRIKPDLMAQGQWVNTVNPLTSDGYISISGTSFSCALGSGAGAILLSAMPGLSPITLRDLLIQYATHYTAPDNIHGYGLIDLENIMLNLVMKPGVSVSKFHAVPGLGKNTLSWISDREINNDKWIVSKKDATEKYVPVFAVDGRKYGLEAQEYAYTDNKVTGTEVFTYKLSAQLVSGQEVSIDSVRVESTNPSGRILLNNSPNPFNNETKISFGLDQAQTISLKIYNLNGQMIKTLIENQLYEAQFHHLSWNATNDQNQPVSTGSYYLQLISESGDSMIKLLYIK